MDYLSVLVIIVSYYVSVAILIAIDAYRYAQHDPLLRYQYSRKAKLVISVVGGLLWPFFVSLFIILKLITIGGFKDE